jgi:hypothetical protein
MLSIIKKQTDSIEKQVYTDEISDRRQEKGKY